MAGDRQRVDTMRLHSAVPDFLEGTATQESTAPLSTLPTIRFARRCNVIRPAEGHDRLGDPTEIQNLVVTNVPTDLDVQALTSAPSESLVLGLWY